MIRKISVLFVALVAFVCVAWYLGWWVPNRPDPDKYPISGIDVSHHNGPVNWAKVKVSGVKFAFIKATEGSNWQDNRFQNNWSESKKAGVYRGAYHFFSTTSSGESQALNFISNVPKEVGMLPPVIDVEFSKSRSRMSDAEFYEELKILQDAMESYYGVKPIIYTTREFLENYFEGRMIDRLWAREIKTKVTDWAPDWVFWQYTNRGRVPGIRGRVDLNVYRKKLFDFEKLLLR
ncbi:MAG: GH25 family lysozyme [Verrucomicrobiales bacterium]|nr:GH25 family lysozyme [Verrucomicrobiales bacterium]